MRKMRLQCKNCAFEWLCMYFSGSKISYELQVLIMTHNGVIKIPLHALSVAFGILQNKPSVA